VVSQRHLMAVVTFMIGCAFLVLMVGCAGTSSDTSEEKEQGSSPQATQSEEARCEGTRKTNVNMPVRYTTNDLPGCPKGGLLLGTDKTDELAGEKGDDEIRGLGGNDVLAGGPGSDILYGGEGDDFLDHGDYRDEGDSEDVFYGGDGNDQLNAEYGPRAKLYCGEGRDDYAADKDDYVDSSCEKKVGFGGGA
jgi:Ca2+-binding RTX toxin-like protein